MKKRVATAMTAAGLIVLLAGLLVYGLGVHELLPVPRPAFLAAGTTLIGVLLIVWGACDLFIKKTREIEIEEKDERNITIANAAMASGFKVMSLTVAIAVTALSFAGSMDAVTCFVMIGAYVIGQIVFIIRIYQLNKKM